MQPQFFQINQLNNDHKSLFIIGQSRIRFRFFLDLFLFLFLLVFFCANYFLCIFRKIFCEIVEVLSGNDNEWRHFWEKGVGHAMILNFWSLCQQKFFTRVFEYGPTLKLDLSNFGLMIGLFYALQNASWKYVLLNFQYLTPRWGRQGQRRIWLLPFHLDESQSWDK